MAHDQQRALPSRLTPHRLKRDATAVSRRVARTAHAMPSGIEFRVHPLVLLNMSDHYTRHEPARSRAARRLPRLLSAAQPARARRFKAQQATGEPPRVLGCLLGTHTARVVDIANSFEIKYDGFVNGVPQLDAAFLAHKQEQCAHVVVCAA